MRQTIYPAALICLEYRADTHHFYFEGYTQACESSPNLCHLPQQYDIVDLISGGQMCVGEGYFSINIQSNS